MIDEGPSSADLDRFGGDTVRCPSCGADVWAEVDTCPKCHADLDGGGRTPFESWWRQRWIVFVAIMALIAFLLVYVF